MAPLNYSDCMRDDLTCMAPSTVDRQHGRGRVLHELAKTLEFQGKGPPTLPDVGLIRRQQNTPDKHPPRDESSQNNRTSAMKHHEKITSECSRIRRIQEGISLPEDLVRT